MTSQLQVSVGPQAIRGGDSTDVLARGGVTGDLIVSELNGRYFEQVYRGNTFTACNTAAQALSLNSTTATGLILTNPVGSGKLLVLLEVCVALATAPAGISTLILTGNVNPLAAAVTHTAALTIQNALLGGGVASVAKADSQATMPTLTVLRAVGGGPVATGSINSAFIKDEIAGAIVLSPNTSISLQCLTTAISAVTSMTWAEVPV